MAQKCNIQFTNENGEVEQYNTASVFANAYRLSIPSVMLWLRQGYSPEKILLLAKDKVCKHTAKSAVTYQGISYPSLSAAGTALGITPTQLYQTRKKMKKSDPNCSDLEVLAYVCERRGKAESLGKGMSKPFEFMGIEYASRTEALNAYHLPRVSVDTTLRRNPGMTDAEANCTAFPISRRGRSRPCLCEWTASL